MCLHFLCVWIVLHFQSSKKFACDSSHTLPAALRLKNDARHVSGVPSEGACRAHVLGVCPLLPPPTPPHAWGPSNAHIDRSLLHQQGHFQDPGATGGGRPIYFPADGGDCSASSCCGRRPSRSWKSPRRSLDNNEACLCMLTSIIVNEACLSMLSSILDGYTSICRCIYTHYNAIRVCAMILVDALLHHTV